MSFLDTEVNVMSHDTAHASLIRKTILVCALKRNDTMFPGKLKDMISKL